MEINRCPHCMRELTGHRGGACPFCGFNAQKSPQPAEAMPRNTILNGKYLVGDVLGRGGFGITYIGFDLSLESRVAIKEYYPSGAAMRREGESELYWSSSYKFHSSREDAKNYFLKEARKMARVENIPSVVRVREMFLANETAYIVMDYVEGETLKARLRREGPMTYTACYALLRPMMQDLCEIHRQGVIHRDISPDNIMIQGDGSVKLLDLGAAKDLNKHSDEVSVPVGKNGYSPMEQYLNNGRIGPWTDVYALCATIYYACYGKRVPQSLERLEQDTLRFDLPTREPIPPYVVGALRKGLAVRAADRTQSVDALLDQLEEEQTTILRPARQPGAAPAPVPAAKPAKKPRPAPARSAAPARPAGKGKVIGIGAAAAVAVVSVLCAALFAAKPDVIQVTRDGTPGAGVEAAASSEEQAAASAVSEASESAAPDKEDVDPEVDAASEEKASSDLTESGEENAASSSAASSKPASSVAASKTDSQTKPVSDPGTAASSKPASSVAASKTDSQTKPVDDPGTTSNVETGLTEVTNEKVAAFGFSSGSYTGQWKDGKPYGYGKWSIVVLRQEDTYEGNWVDGKACGKGKKAHYFCRDDGKTIESIYEGNYIDGKRNGQGKMTYYGYDGKKIYSIYEGNWIDGKLNGYGKKTYYNDDGKTIWYIQEGNFTNYELNGQGKVMLYKDDGKTVSAIYEGNCTNGNPNGQGKATQYEDDGKTVSAIHEGNYTNGSATGQGKAMFYRNGEVYSVYEGEWAKGKENGQGTMTYADGRVESGTWKNGKFVG